MTLRLPPVFLALICLLRVDQTFFLNFRQSNCFQNTPYLACQVLFLKLKQCIVLPVLMHSLSVTNIRSFLCLQITSYSHLVILFWPLSTSSSRRTTRRMLLTHLTPDIWETFTFFSSLFRSLYNAFLLDISLMLRLALMRCHNTSNFIETLSLVRSPTKATIRHSYPSLDANAALQYHGILQYYYDDDHYYYCYYCYYYYHHQLNTNTFS